MTKLSKAKMSETCKDILTNVLETVGNNLVMEAAIFANSTGSIPEDERDREAELDTFIRAINGQLRQARAQAVIYIDNMVIDSIEDEPISNTPRMRTEGVSFTHTGKLPIKKVTQQQKVTQEQLDQMIEYYNEGIVLYSSYFSSEHKIISFADLDFSGLHFGGSNLNKANFAKSNLRHANLIGCKLEGAELWEADLTGSNLVETNLIEANLTGANLSYALMLETVLTEAYLTCANLTNANLSGAILHRADLRDANLTGARLTISNLTNANLKGADLSYANLSYANLTDANLTGANLAYADLTGVNFKYVKC